MPSADGHRPVPAGEVSLTSPLWSGTAAAALTSDAALVAALLETETALAWAWCRLGVHDAEATAAVARAADPDRFDAAELALAARGGGNPVIPLVKGLRAAVADDPEAPAGASAAVHAGATSQDVLDTALLLVAARVRGEALRLLERACAACAGLAREHRHTLAATHTLTQRGLPTTFGLRAAGWLHGLRQAARALAAVPIPAQLGGAGGTLAASVEIAGVEDSLRLVGEFADGLGLAEPLVPWHVHRQPVTALGDALATVCGALGKIALDVLTASRPEVGELSEPRAPGRGGSSAMPQKHNPVLSVLIHSGARTAPAHAAELHRCALAVDERPDGAWHAEWPALRELLRTTGAACELAAELLEGLEVHADRMAENLAADDGLELGERLVVALGDALGADRVRALVADSAGGGLREALVGAGVDPARVDDLLDPRGYLGAADAFIDRILENEGETR